MAILARLPLRRTRSEGFWRLLNPAMNIDIKKLKANRKRLLAVVLVVVLAAVAVLALMKRDNRTTGAFRTVALKRGNLLASISATGTVEPEEVVDIGAQVAGRIVSFGQDKHGEEVDYGSVVEAGTVLARIDDALYSADVDQAVATLGQAKASLQRSQADLGQLRAKLTQAQRDWARAQKLGPSDALSQADYDAAQSAHDTAKANLDVGKAAIVQAEKTVKQAEAQLRRAKQNLTYCTIVSPVKGVIIDRRVNIGQTVVSSLNAPSLFLLAKDLKRMQVWVSVNEADIGNIRTGQSVRFTIDAYPGETFQGEVGKVRLNATMTQNVVTYTVEVVTDNSSGKLLPYLTANVNFIIGERKNVLLVPNAALRWEPENAQIAPEFRKKGRKGKKGGENAQPAGNEEKVRRVVWVPQGSQVRPMKVTPGLTDGTLTELQGAGLKEGDLVVLGEMESEQGAGGAAGGSPFTPQLFKKPAEK
jgi:HlyD family secretion protein